MTDQTTTTIPLLEVLPPLPRVAPATDAEKDRIASRHAKTVPFGAIVLGDDNTRDAAVTDIAGLARSIRLVGLVSPITVEPFGSGRWLVAAGHRRYLALAALGFGAEDRVPVHVMPKAQHEVRAARMLAENRHRVDLDAIDEALLIVRLKAWMTHRQIAAHLGVAPNAVGERLLLLELPPDAQDLVRSGEMPIGVGVRLGRMIRNGAPEAVVGPLLRGGVKDLDVSLAESRVAMREVCEATARRLQARGFDVVSSLRAAPPRPDMRVVRGAWIGSGTRDMVASMNAAAWAAATISSPGRKPVLLVEPGSYGEASVSALRWVPKGRPVADVAADWAEWALAAEERHEARMGWLRDGQNGAPIGVALRVLLQRLVADNPESLAPVLGVAAVVGEDGEIDRVETACRWVDSLSDGDVARGLMAATVFTAQDDDVPGSTRSRFWDLFTSWGMPAVGPDGEGS